MAGVLPSDELTDEPSDFGSLRPGTRLGRYELLVPIARGGMARVWAARQHGQRGFQKLVAIKTILPHLAEEPEFERMFLDEARIASGVHHPNACEIYELGEERRTLYMAMEWVSGDSLSRVLRASGKTEPLDPRIVARVVADACAGVHAAHELADDDGRQLGVVHRDMSPHNILLTHDGVAKVCDFGVAKALGQLHEQTSAGQLKGKIGYMSPEQLTGQAVDRRSDVFSLGCVLYEATTGVRPFKGDRDHIVMQAILKNDITPPTAILRNYPPELERIVMRALAHQPILRFATAERMRFALEELLTKGQLVTQSNVAQVVRARIGELLERRRERIKQASAACEQKEWDPASVAPTREPKDHRSGVKAARQTLQLPAIQPNAVGPAVTPRMGVPSVDPGFAGPRSTRSLPVAAATEPEPVLSASDATLHEQVVNVSSSTLPNAAPAAEELDVDADETLEPAPPSRTMALSNPEVPVVAISGPPVDGAPRSVRPKPPPLSVRPDLFGATARVGEWSSPGHIPIPIVNHVADARNPYGETAPYDIVRGDLLEPRAAGAGQYAVAAFIGLLVAVAIGGGGFYLWQSHLRAGALPVPTAPTPAPTPSPTLSPRPAASPPASVTVASAAPLTTPDTAPSLSAPGPGPASSAVPVSSAASAPSVSASSKAHSRPKAPPKEPALPDNPY